MGRLRLMVALVVFAGSVFGGTRPGTAQTNAPPVPASAQAKAPPDEELLRRLRELEEKVQYLQQKLEEREARDSAQSPAPKVDEQVRQLDQKVRVLEREKEIDEEAAAAKSKETPVLTWKDGFTLKTPDDRYQLKIGGWILYDVAFFNEDDSLKQAVGDEQDGTGFRSVRLRLSGSVYDNVEYQLEVDFAGENGADTPAFFDTYVQLKDIPSLGGNKGQLRLGHFREPFGLEELTSLPKLTFVERALSNVFVPDRNPGIQWSDALLGEAKQERLTYAVGVFKTADSWPSSNDSDEDQGYNITARVTGLPWYQYNGERLLHLGAAYSHRTPDGAILGWNARPETRLSLFRYAVADTTTPLFRLRDARAEEVNLYNLEAALVYGPFSVQGEYTVADVATTFDGDHTFDGYYAQASYLLTGEHRTYRNATGVFDRVKPKKNFGWRPGDGWGAWEVAARYSRVNLTDGAIRGGKQDAITAGLNWYLNPNTRLALDYIYNDIEHDLYEGNLEVLQLRFFVDF